MELIRTGIRDKLRRGLSYPIGAEIITAAMVGVPQVDDLWIGFGRAGWMTIRAANTSTQNQFMRSFSAVLNFNSGSSYLSLPAVPSEFRQIVREALMRQGLIEVRSWLAAPRSQIWCEGLRTFEVGVSPDTGAVCFVEEENQEVLPFRVAASDK